MSDANSPLFRLQLWRAGLPPALRLLLTVNIATYLAFVLMSIVRAGGLYVDVLALPGTPAGVLARPWTVLTYGVANAYPGFFGLISFAFGALWLNWLGRDLEEQHGSGALFGLYALGALGGVLFALGVGALPAGAGQAAPGTFGTGRFFFGIWGPMLAVLCGLATIEPNRGIGLFLLGVVPLKWIAIVFVVLELAFTQDPTHLGAALTGFFFGLAQKRGYSPGGWAQRLFEPRRRAAPARATAPVGRSVGRPVRTEAPAPRAGAPPAEAHRGGGEPDVDAILDKILEKGYGSLTAEEKRILERASRD